MKSNLYKDGLPEYDDMALWCYAGFCLEDVIDINLEDVMYINSKIVRSRTVIIRSIYRKADPVRVIAGVKVKSIPFDVTIFVETPFGDSFAFDATHLEDCAKSTNPLTALILFGKVKND